MTTTVTVLIQGNKECEVKVTENGIDNLNWPAKTVKPGSFTQVTIHGDQKVEVKEVGEFVS